MPALTFSSVERRPRDEVTAKLQEFGERVRVLRQRTGKSQEVLAHEAGLHRAVVGFIERGERDIGISTLWPLAAALGVPVTALFEDAKPT
jgi:transcriptional regulator with XRE-family HTH domain